MSLAHNSSTRSIFQTLRVQVPPQVDVADIVGKIAPTNTLLFPPFDSSSCGRKHAGIPDKYYIMLPMQVQPLGTYVAITMPRL
jgi:hypothetical protein